MSSERADNLVTKYGESEFLHQADKYLNQTRQAVLDYISALEAEAEALRPCRDGYRLIEKYPSLGDWVLVKFIPGFIQPYKVVQYLEDKWGNRRFGVHMDRQIERWWAIPEVKHE